jgi:hypothetical protein
VHVLTIRSVNQRRPTNPMHTGRFCVGLLTFSSLRVRTLKSTDAIYD